MSSFYKNHIVTGETYKPLLHKKGKRWIVLGLSALSLLGLGTVSTGHISANASSLNNQSQGQSQASKMPAQQNASTKTISNQASALHKQILDNSSMYQHKPTSLSAGLQSSANKPASASAQSASSAVPKLSITPKSISSNSASHRNMGLNLTATPFDLGKGSAKSSVSASSSNVTSASQKATPSLLAVQKSFANNVNNKGMLGVSAKSVSSSSATKPNVPSNSVSVKSSNASSVVSNLASASNSSQNSNVKSASDSNSAVKSGHALNLGVSRQLGDSNDATGNWVGANYIYNKATQTLELTSGKITENNPNSSDTYYTNEPLLSFISDQPFANVKNLKIDSDVDTSDVTDARYMFGTKEDTGKDAILASIDLPANFGKNITNASNMFISDSNLKSLTLPVGFGQNITDASYMFRNDDNLNSLTIPQGFGQNITNARDMFWNDNQLQSLTFPAGFGQNISDAQDMFNMDHLVTLNLPTNFGKNITNASGMFEQDRYSDNGSDSNYNGISNFVLPAGFGQKINNATAMFGAYGLSLYLTNPSQYSSAFKEELTKPNLGSDGDEGNEPYDHLYKPLSQKDKNGKNYTTTAIDFTKGTPQSGKYIFRSNLPAIQYSDIYHSVDGMTNPKSDAWNDISDNYTTPINQVPQGSDQLWYFVDADGKISNNPVKNNNGKVMIAPIFDGLVYKYDKRAGTIEFTNGNLDNTPQFGQLASDNSSMSNVKSLTFDSDINTSKVTDANGSDGMFGMLSSLQSITFHNPNQYSKAIKQELTKPNDEEPFQHLYRKDGNTLTDAVNFVNGNPQTGTYLFHKTRLQTVEIVKHNLDGTTTTTNVVQPLDANAFADYWSEGENSYWFYPKNYQPAGYSISQSDSKYKFTISGYTKTNYTVNSVGNVPNPIVYVYNQEAPKVNVQYNDIYGNDDGFSSDVSALDNVVNKNSKLPSQLSSSDGKTWAYVDKDGNILNNVPTATHNGQVIDIAPIVDGMTYDYNSNINSQTMTFMHGKLNWNNSDAAFGVNTPLSSDARNVVFSKGVDTNISPSDSNLGGMFYYDTNLSDIRGLSDWNVNNVTSLWRFFRSDSSLAPSVLNEMMGWQFNNRPSTKAMVYGTQLNGGKYVPTHQISNGKWMLGAAPKPTTVTSKLPINISIVDGGNDNKVIKQYTVNDSITAPIRRTMHFIDPTQYCPAGDTIPLSDYRDNDSSKQQVVTMHDNGTLSPDSINLTFVKPAQLPTVTVNVVQHDSDGKTTTNQQSVKLSGKSGMINPSDYQPAGYHIDNSDKAVVWNANNTKAIPTNVTFNYTKPPKIQYVKVHFQDIYDGGSYWRDAHSDDPDGLEKYVPKDAIVKQGDQIGVPGSDALTNPKVLNGWALVNSDGFITNKPYARKQKNNNSQMIYVAPVYRGMTYRWSPNRWGQGKGKLEFIAGKPTWNNDKNDSSNHFMDGTTNPKLVNLANVNDIHFDDHSESNRTEGVDFSGLHNASYMLANLPDVQRIELPYTATNLTNASHMFDNDSNLQRVASSKNDNDSVLEELPSLTDGSYMFANDPQLQGEVINSDVGQNMTNAEGMFANDSGLNGDVNYVANPLNKYGHSYQGASTITLPSNFGQNINNAHDMFNGTNLSNYYFPSQFGLNITDASGMYANDSKLHSVQMPNGFGSNINNTTDMFKGDNPNTQSGNFTQMELNDPEDYSSTFNNYLSNISHPFGTDGIANSYRVLDSQGHTTPAVDFSETSATPGTYVFKDNHNEAVQAVKNKIFFINKKTQTMIPGGRLTIKGKQGQSYTVQDSQVPKGFKLADDGTQAFNIGRRGTKHYVNVVSTATPKPHYTPVYSKTVNFTGTIALHYHDGKKDLKDINLPYNIKTNNNHVINDLLNNTNPSATIPADYLNKVIDQYNTKNFSYDNNVQSKQYSNVAVDPNVKGWTNQDTNNPIFHNGTITLDFSANNVNENVHYVYGSHNEGNTQFNGKNDEPGIDTNSQGLNAGYHMDKSNPHNTWIYGNGGSDASGQYNDSDNVNVLPNRDTDNISYQYKGNQLASDKVSGNDQHATDAGDNTYDVNSTNHPNMPSDYHLVNKDNTFGFDNGTHAIAILPDQATDTINYVNGKTTVGNHKFSGNNVGAKGASDTNFDVDKDNEPDLPTGYHLVNNDNNFNYDNGTHNVAVAPDKATDTIDYQYKNQTKGTNRVTGNTSAAKNASDTTFNVTPTSDKGMPVGYHLVNNNNQFSYDGKTHDVAIVPNTASAKVNYRNGTKTIASQSFNGNASNAQGASDISIDITPSNPQGLPAGYHFVSNDNKVPFDNNTHDIAITPNRTTDTVDYQYKGATKGTNQLTGNSSIAQGASDTTFNVTPQSDKGMPTGYQLVNNDNKFDFNGTTHDVAITPKHASDTVNYQYDNHTMSSHNFGGNTSTAQGASDTSFDVNANNDAGIPTGYHLVNKDNNFNYDGNQHNVAITPDQTTDTIDYNNGNQTISSQTFTGDTNKAQGAKNSTIDITPTNDKGLPQGYHLANNDNKFSYDGDTHAVSIVPNQATDTVNYQYKGNTQGSHQFTGNDHTAKGASDTTLDINGNNEAGIPTGYHLVNKDNTFDYDNGTHNVAITPNKATDTVDYQYNNQTVGNTQLSGNTSTAQGASDTNFDINSKNEPGLPSGYHLANKDNTFNYDGGTHDVVVEPNTATDIVDYNYGNKTVGNHDFSGNSSTAQGAKGTTFDVKSGNDAGLPNGYHLVNSDNTFNYDGTTHAVAVTPNRATDTVNYQYKGTTRGTNQLTGNSSQAQGASDTSFDVTPQSDKGMPQGYHLANNDNKFDFDGDSHNVAILPNNATDTVNYQYNGTTKSSHQFSGNSSQATGASDTNFDVNSDNEPDLPVGYHLVNKDNQFNYDGNQHNVAIAPDTASATINYDYGTKTINSHKFNGNSSTAQGASDNSLDITPTNDQGLPTGYHLVNNSNKFNYDNNSHSVAIAPNKDTNTVDYYLNDKSNVLGHNQFSGNDDKAQGASDTSFTVNSSDATGVPAGYHLVKPTNTFGFDNTTNYVQIAKNGGSAKVHYVLPDGSYVPASDDNGGNGTINGTTGESVDPASQVPVPAGFTPVQSDLVNPNKPYNAKTNPINPYRFGPQNGEANPSDTIHVTPNRIKGTVTVHLTYNETNGKVDSTKDVTYNIDNHVGDTFSDGDGDSDISSAEYLQPNYKDDNNTSDAVPLDWRQAANGDNLNYHKTYNFNYTAISGGDIKVQYVDMDQGAIPVGNEKTDGNGHPIIGMQDLGNLGPVGTQVQLGAKGANDGNGVKDVLEAPTGFYLEHNLNPLTVDIDANGNTITIGLGGSDDTTPGNVSMIK